MGRFWGLFRHEFGMSIRRRGLWVAYGLLFVFHTALLFAPPPLGEWTGEAISQQQVGSVAGRFLVALNVFFPVVAGILSADRLVRDARLGVSELQTSTPLGRPTYLAAKFLVAVFSCLLPLWIWVMAIALVMTAIGHTPPSFLLAAPLAFLAITVPAFTFVVAFSLACPLVMPLPVYQILFTGYWFWANFVPPKLFPTVNGTLLTPSGTFVLRAFFGVESLAAPVPASASLALLNLLCLGALSAAALLFADRNLARRARLA